MLLAVQTNRWKKETCKEHNLEADGNCKKKGDCLESKPPFHLHTFPSPIKCKQLREASIKAVRREPFDKKRSWQPAPSDRVCSFILLMDWQLMKIPYQPFFLVMKVKRKNQKEHYLQSHWRKM